MVLLGLLPVAVVGEFPDLHFYIPTSYKEYSKIKIPIDEGMAILYACTATLQLLKHTFVDLFDRYHPS